MKLIKSVDDAKRIRKNLTGDVGLVPTMGALHKGHISLIKKSVEICDTTFVSIFVNPTQFNDKNDYKNYPITLEKDLAMIEAEGVDYVFVPDYNEMYPDDYAFHVSESKISNILCGRFRPGHFDGVLTVVMKLFNIIKPNIAFFGEKDYQQYLLIENMVKAFFMDIKIVPCPTVRESDGLALSSRNLLLSDDNRKKAPLIYKTISDRNITDDEAKKILEKNGFSVDYVETHFGRRFVAAYLGSVRLIDNVMI
ncbi:MAG: pantoate--beta-alanine ligase [Elusimicrobiales bacterium]|jgi:pantoate--beta-alanine ligase|nr:pantoate--beta-alanine ligase [Elusimicrobiales bacterium]NLH39023.1 pantoate--beta-alanine ligase [Elusimicrobiota bacterium]